MSVDALEITYGGAMGSAKFHRAVGADGEAGSSANINLAGNKPVYIWYRNGDGDPILRLAVTSASDAPEGFVRLSKSLAKGAEEPVYLCYSVLPDPSQPELLPIQELLIGTADEPSLAERGFERMEQPMTEADGAGKYLWIRRGAVEATGADAAGPQWTIDDLGDGEWFDALDDIGYWRVGRIASRTDNSVTVNYKGLTSLYNDVISLSESKRFAKLGTHTHMAQFTRRGELWNITTEDTEPFIDKLRSYIDGTMSDDRMRETFHDVEVPEFTHRLLRSSFKPEAEELVCSTVEEVIQWSAHFLAQPGEVDPVALEQLQRVTLCDNSCDFFIDRHGVISRQDEGWEEYTGSIARLPIRASKWFLRLLNKLGDSGVMDSIIDRLRGEGEEAVSVETVTGMVSIVHGGRYCYKQEWFDTWMPGFVQAVSEKVLRIAVKDLKNVPPDSIDSFIEELRQIMQAAFDKAHTAMSEKDAYYHVERLECALGARLLGCEFLGLRVKGISIIERLIVSVKNAASQSAGAHAGATTTSHRSRGPVARWLTREIFGEELQKHEIVQLVVGAPLRDGSRVHAHEEILKQAKNIMIFAVEEGFFPPEYMHCLWQAIEEATAAGRRVLVDLVTGLERVFTAAHLRAFLGLLTRVEATALEPIMIELLQTTLSAYEAATVSESMNGVDDADGGDGSSGKEEEGEEEDMGLRAMQTLWQCVAKRVTRMGVPVWQTARSALLQLLQDLTAAKVGVVVQRFAEEASDILRDPASPPADRVAALDGLTHIIATLPLRAREEDPEDGTQDALYNHPVGEELLAETYLNAVLRFQVDSRGALEKAREAAAAKRAKAQGSGPGPEPEEASAEGGDGKSTAAAAADAATVEGAAAGAGTGVGAWESTSVELAPDTTYGWQLRVFFRALAAVLQNGEPQMEWTELQRLWDAFYVHAIDRAEREVFMKFLRDLDSGAEQRTELVHRTARPTPVQPTPPLSEACASKLFDALCDRETVDLATAGPGAFACFRHYFRSLNAASGAVTNSASQDVIVESLELRGMETLWDLAVRSDHPDVLPRAIKLLSNMHLSGRTDEDTRTAMRTFVERCVRTISEGTTAAQAAATAQGAAAEEEERVGRYAHLLREYVEHSEKHASGSGAHRIVVKVSRAGHMGPPVELNLQDGPQMTVQMLRALVGERMGVPGDRVRVLDAVSHVSVSAALYDARRAYHYISVAANSIHCRVLRVPEVDTRDHSAPSDEDMAAARGPWNYPKELLCTSESTFAALLEALTLRTPSAVRSLWALVESLPLNRGVERTVHTLGDALTADTAGQPLGEALVAWETVLPAAAPIRLLYSLQIVESVLENGAHLPGGESVDARDWLIFFVAKGGFEHLLRVVRSMDVDLMMSSPLYQRCVSGVFQLMSKLLRLMRKSGAAATAAAGADADAAGAVADAGADADADADADAGGATREAGKADGDEDGEGEAGTAGDAADDDDDDEQEQDAAAAARAAAAAAEAEDDVVGGAVLPQDLQKALAERMSIDDASVAPVFDVTLHLFAKCARPGAADGRMYPDPQPKEVRSKRNQGGSSAAQASSMQDMMGIDDDDMGGSGKNLGNNNNNNGKGGGEDDAAASGALVEEPGVTEPASEDGREAVKQSTSLARAMLTCLRSMIELRPAVAHSLTAVGDLGSILCEALLRAPTERMRRTIQTAALALLLEANEAEGPALRRAILPAFAQRLDGIYPFHQTATHYFALFSALLRRATWQRSTPAGEQGGEAAKPAADAEADAEGCEDELAPGVQAGGLFRALASFIVMHPYVEVGASTKDYMLCGALSALHGLVEGRPALLALAREPMEVESDVVHAEAEPGLGPNQRTLLHVLFFDCLFSTPSAAQKGKADAALDASPPKCKHADTRAAAFHLIGALAKGDSENSTALARLAYGHNATIAAEAAAQRKKKQQEDSVSRYRYRDAPRSAAGYVGLLNLGCICYMNSSMQQFFMIPAFRRGLLAFDEHDEDVKPDDSVIYQVQRQFAYLQESEREDYNPAPLCNSFKDWDGNPINVGVQRDASEYLSELFQKLESALQGTDQEHLIRDVFGGVLTNELIADGGRYSQRDEPFQFLTVQVQEMGNLERALHGLISGEKLDGYKWENDNGERVELPTTKRVSIKKLPQHLIVHLKRFEFDMVHMRQMKVNDAFEFPMTLNMKPFTLHGREDRVRKPQGEGEGEGEGAEAGAKDEDEDEEEYEYRLMGCVIHVGTCEAGHYFSYICGRDGEGRPMDKWFEFNDSWVSAYNPKSLERDAFGGETTYRTYNTYTRSYSTYTGQRSQNAFVLFYDKVVRSSAAAGGGGGGGGAGGSAGDIEVRTRADLTRWLAQKTAALQAIQANRCPVPKALYDEVWEDNEAFWRRRNIMNDDYFGFVQSLVASAAQHAQEQRQRIVGADPIGEEDIEIVPYPHAADGTPLDAFVASSETDSQLTITSLAMSFVAGGATAAKARTIKKYSKLLRSLLAGHNVACLHALHQMLTTPGMMADAVMPSTVTTRLREEPPLFGAFSVALKTVLRAESLKPVDADSDAVVGSVASLTVRRLVDMMSRVHRHWASMHYLMQLLNDVAVSRPEAAELLLHYNALARASDLLVYKNSPYPEVNSATATCASRSREYIYDKPDWSKIARLVGTLLRCKLPVGAHEHALPVEGGTGAGGGSQAADGSLPDGLPVRADATPSASQLPPATPLTPLESAFLRHKSFLVSMLTQLEDPEVFDHLLHENLGRMDEACSLIESKLLRAEGHAVSAPFKWVRALAATPDGRPSERVGRVMGAVLEAMEKGKAVFRETELSIMELAKLAESPAVLQWMSENWPSWKWCYKWLLDHKVPPRYGDRLMKPQRGHLTYNYSIGGYNTVRSERPACLMRNLQRIRNGITGLYPDEYQWEAHHNWLTGKRILVKMRNGTRQPATVSKMRPMGSGQEPEHLVEYDTAEFSSAWYTMSGRIWTMEDPNELFPIVPKEGEGAGERAVQLLDGPPIDVAELADLEAEAEAEAEAGAGAGGGGDGGDGEEEEEDDPNASSSDEDGDGPANPPPVMGENENDDDEEDMHVEMA